MELVLIYFIFSRKLQLILISLNFFLNFLIVDPCGSRTTALQFWGPKTIFFKLCILCWREPIPVVAEQVDNVEMVALGCPVEGGPPVDVVLRVHIHPAGQQLLHSAQCVSHRF